MLNKLTMPSRPVRSLTAASAAIAASVAMLAAGAGSGTALAASPKPNNDYLGAVTTAPGGTAWAVGLYVINPALTKALIERWNGSSWRLVPSPTVGGPTASNYLNSVAAPSSSSAWAVGFVRTSSDRSLILHWNGKSWRSVTSPSPGGSAASYLNGVTAASGSNAWAVGYYRVKNDVARTLILHWNGRTWMQVNSPNPGGAGGSYLTGVAAVSRSSAWAVGNYYIGGPSGVRRTLALHWNGRAWKQVPSPNPGGISHDNSFSGVAVASATSVWAAGDQTNGTKLLTLIEHWNGKSWKPVASPNGPSTANFLYSVAAPSPSAAFAVGYFGNGVTYLTLAEHWNGRSWDKVSSPSPSGIFGVSLLGGITAVSATDAWAVGHYNGSAAARTLILHWNGKAWKRVPSPNR